MRRLFMREERAFIRERPLSMPYSRMAISISKLSVSDVSKPTRS